MADKSRIEWTDATWNPVTGCSHVSAGCEHCYAETRSLRMGWSTQPWTRPNAADNVILHHDRLDQPIRWQKPRRIFVNSMSDLFHELIPDFYIDSVLRVMANAHQHTFQILTKRPDRMRDYIERWYHSERRDEGGSHRGCRISPAPNEGDGPRAVPLPNVWLGVSIEEDRWCHRADILRTVPATVRFLSLEPLLGPLPSLDLARIQWVITGGESGAGYRPCQEQWVRDIRDTCLMSGVAFLHKQWGGRTPKSQGRIVDGRTWDQYPNGMGGIVGVDMP